MDKISETFAILERARRSTDHILVAYSGGKDSLCVLDLCSRVFEKVSAFHLYFVPGLSVVEKQMAYARERWGVEVRQYPGRLLCEGIRRGLYCNSHYRNDSLPKFKTFDFELLASLDAGTSLCASGAKRADSIWRRRMLATWGDRADIVYPIIGWNLFDVLSYLRARDIPVPDSSQGTATGLGFMSHELLWLHDDHPEDFAKVERVFPFVRAAVYRREWYGIGDAKVKQGR